MTSEPSYASMVVTDLLDAFASNEPVPGGGSASALAAAIGASLLIMVAGLPKTKRGAPEEAADLSEASARLRPLRDELMSLVDDDSDAYKAVVSATRLPKATDAEKQARRAAIDTAMRAATETPLETMRVCQQAMRGATIVAAAGNPNAASDTGVAVELLLAALRGAALNIAVNLKGLSDTSFAARVSEEARQLEADATADAARARELLAG
ncbi:MAG: cyclodeaminase/cyclohydrolase family protein [Acidimicrobiia bacterium]|nr:cyclodeaminase/cyclohydrolase family protein [Acidimicrobiia bacterium]